MTSNPATGRYAPLRILTWSHLLGPNPFANLYKALRYGPWLNRIWRLADDIEAPAAGDTPRISLIVPVFETKPTYLDDLLGSFRAQAPGLAEMILVDDGSQRTETRAWLDRHDNIPGLRILRLAQNQGIAAATNAGIEAATAFWVGLVDHDDMIAPHGIKMAVRALDAMPQAQFLFTDEAVVGPRREARNLFLKPGFDPVLLSGVNYVNHLSLYRKDRLAEVGSLDSEFDGSQDYELVLRYCSGLAADEIVHLPYPAYIWRRHGGSFSRGHLPKATTRARTALARHFARPDRQITVDPSPVQHDLHRIMFGRSDDAWPKISVVIPNRDQPAMIKTVVDGLLTKTDYPAFEIVIADNGTTDAETLSLYDQWRANPRILVEIRPAPFNFAAMINRGVELSSGEHYLLLNNDIEIEDPGWLKEMVACLDHPGTGIVGAKLLYPSRRIQHAGVILGLGGYAGHWFLGYPAKERGPMGRLAVRNSLTIVTAAAMLISGRCWAETGQFDSENFTVAYNDVDYCARARACGFGVIWTPHAELLHHESASRGSDDTRRNKPRFDREKTNLRERHGTDTFEDPAFSPWWSRSRSKPRRRHRKGLPKARHFMGFPSSDA